MSSSDRLAEIARKKEQLAEIKRRRQERARTRTQPGVLAGTDLVDGDVNTLVEQLLSESSYAPPPSKVTISEDSQQQQQQQQQQARPAATRMRFRSRASLGVSEVRHEDILPAETIVYTKGAQTDPVAELEPKAQDEAAEQKEGGSGEQESKEEQVQAGEGEVAETGSDDGEGEEGKHAEEQVKVMDEGEAQDVMNTHDFQQFFDGASLLVERGGRIRVVLHPPFS
ncbi:hypothetical protein PTSG_11432 [Salpingoeca rosetta]|uniref:Uncharacterized protein n=1 Tax=Salpingoeca rosetta (strain ATCC 50818 / BSB-021) TaxID=946362 RepID=F2UTE9_SALR5|nr:uncharacterized protein PTSG_11432 [Salpingoeca rosetta]EGD82831.1 hypothetical protein PTSG_11432 [Salpingoeca rosetta]|eukprot:XP_004987554.1 hypothetical protein PTSG_11432 [Salpingoeca rosetta]